MAYRVRRLRRLFLTLKGEANLALAHLGGAPAISVQIGKDLKMRVRCNDIFARPLLYGVPPEIEVQKQLMEIVKPGMTVLDIGANIGYYTLLLARQVGPAGRILAFEPNPVCFEELCRNLAMNDLAQVEKFPIGLGERDATMQLILPAAGKESHSSLHANATFEPIGSVAVAIRSLDAFWTEQASFRVDVIKCDVEGAEWAVFRGAAALLARWKPLLVFECADNLTSAFEHTVYEILTLLVGQGYAVTQLSTGNWLARPAEK